MMSKDAQIVQGNIKGVVNYFINVESAMEVYIMITYVQQHNLQYRNMANRVEVIIDLKEPLNAICVEKSTGSWSVRITWVLITGED